MINLETIYNDERGQIYLLLGDLKEHKEITLFSTNKGFARGGCIHSLHDEFNVVLEGKIHYFVGDKESIMSKGESMKIPRNTPHYFISLTDSLVVEWGCDPKEKVEKYKPFRDIVDVINKNQHETSN